MQGHGPSGNLDMAMQVLTRNKRGSDVPCGFAELRESPEVHQVRELQRGGCVGGVGCRMINWIWLYGPLLSLSILVNSMTMVALIAAVELPFAAMMSASWGVLRQFK